MRPIGLPEFKKPPLNEVFLGIQFAPALGYRQVHIGDVYRLFSEKFPEVQEHAALPPAFEAFGLQTPQQFNFGLANGALHDRFWFMSNSGDELIQFQNDRLIHNWRKIGDRTNAYPRFEYMIDSFKAEMKALEDFFASLEPQALSVTQAEICYINHIMPAELTSGISVTSLFNFFNFVGNDPDDIRTSFRRVIKDRSDRQIGRLICEISSAMSSEGQPMVLFTLTVRGTPDKPNIASTLDFMSAGRESIINAFTTSTTSSAHIEWERVR